MSDLLREIKIPVEIDFIQVSSYGASKTSSGVIKIKKDIDLPIVGKHVLVVEDIIDYGYTLNYLLKFLKAKKPKSVWVCVMLDKTSRREVEVPIAYKGFEVPDKFIVGYGLDFAESRRNIYLNFSLTGLSHTMTKGIMAEVYSPARPMRRL